MTIAFSKYHGAGNDFVLIDNRDKNLKLSTDNIAFICNRHFGIGADGLMLLNASDAYDFEMVYFNSDGNESTMCGNGGRCITAFAASLGLINDKTNFIAIDGEHQATIINNNADLFQVRLKMNDVSEFKMYNNDFILNTGSPQYIKFVKDVKSIDVYNEGKAIRNNKEISEKGVNVDFVEIKEDYLFVRTFERGVEDETLACGTGVTASAIAYALNNDVEIVKIKTLGGELKVSFTKDKDYTFKNIWLEGPAQFVFKGELVINE
ncbi:MAG: diaminopimelate epimerase [Bacteroidota bacterium]